MYADQNDRFQDLASKIAKKQIGNSSKDAIKKAHEEVKKTMEAQKNEIKAEIRRKSGMEAELASKIYIVSSLLAAFALVY
jgi:hypothetical protein